MDSPGNKHWACSYLLDPLSEPQPSEESGPGSHFRPDSAASKLPSPPPSAHKLSKNPFRQSPPSYRSSASSTKASAENARNAYPSPPHSASPKQRHISPSTQDTTRGKPSVTIDESRRRGRSLDERFPGDMSHRPLDQIRKDAKLAHRAPHLRKSQAIGPDTIDNLSTVGGSAYHHAGPYDAALFARNVSEKSSPLIALKDSNAETIKATPPDKIIDSVRGHRPLDGVAAYAPGEADRNGHTYHYEQGDNMMISGGIPEGGAYKRWPGVVYHPGDIKGKGEPSYGIEKALKERDYDRERHIRASSGGIEMTARPKYPDDRLGKATGHEGRGSGQNPVSRRRKTTSVQGREDGQGRVRRHSCARRSCA